MFMIFLFFLCSGGIKSTARILLLYSENAGKLKAPVSFIVRCGTKLCCGYIRLLTFKRFISSVIKFGIIQS